MTDGHPHLLLVDGDTARRTQMVAAHGQQVEFTQAATAAEALDCLRGGGLFDAVLLALDSADLDAFALIDQIRGDDDLSATAIIVLGGDTATVERALQGKASIDLPRGFGPMALQRRLAVIGQAITLMQTEKFATLGRLSAGLAHELNNPAAAAQRGSLQLRETLQQLQHAFLALGQLGLTPPQLKRIVELDALAHERALTPSDLESLSRSDRESEVEEWLVERGVADAWQPSTQLVSMGYGSAQLEQLARDFTGAQLPAVIHWLSTTYTMYTLLEELAMGTERMVAIARSMKSFSHIGQEKPLPVNINDGLDSTLIMLRSKLRHGITVHRQYAADLPPIDGYGSELSQVWTNLIDNAVDAMDGQGVIQLRTSRNGGSVVIEIEDNGPGIPEAIQSKIFDQFFTTKPPGKGTGLGLNIGFEIVVHKHHGSITLNSQPGSTRFEIRLPIHAADPA